MEEFEDLEIKFPCYQLENLLKFSVVWITLNNRNSLYKKECMGLSPKNCGVFILYIAITWTIKKAFKKSEVINIGFKYI